MYSPIRVNPLDGLILALLRKLATKQALGIYAGMTYDILGQPGMFNEERL